MGEYSACAGIWMRHRFSDPMYCDRCYEEKNEVCNGTLPFGRDICRYAVGGAVFGVVYRVGIRTQDLCCFEYAILWILVLFLFFTLYILLV